MKKKLALMLSTVMVAGAIMGCSANGTSSSKEGETETPAKETEQATEVVVKHQLGEDTVPVNPEKVVVFDFGTLDTLDKIGVEVTGVPQANIPSYLSKYEDEKYENVGGLKEPDFEKINELSPDLIVITGRTSEAYDELSEIAPTIYLGVDTTRYLDSFEENLEIIGDIFPDKKDEIEKEYETITDEIEEVRSITEKSEDKGLILLTNDGNISAYGNGSRFGLIHDVLNVKVADENIESSTHGQSVTFEYIGEVNPDLMFVVDRSAAIESGTVNASDTLKNDIVDGTNAAKNNKIIYLSPDYWYLSGGGLQSVSEMVKEVKTGIE